MMFRRFLTTAARSVNYSPESAALHTKYGWFLVPSKYSKAYVWTIKQIESSITNPLLSLEEKQSLVDAWAEKDIKPPKVKAKSRQEIEQEEKDFMYHTQLRESDPPPQTSDQPGKRQTRPRSSKITFVHAWNYYVAEKLSEMEQPDKRQIMAKQWASMPWLEKETWRQRVLDLLPEERVKKGRQEFHPISWLKVWLWYRRTQVKKNVPEAEIGVQWKLLSQEDKEKYREIVYAEEKEQQNDPKIMEVKRKARKARERRLKKAEQKKADEKKRKEQSDSTDPTD